MEKKDKAYWSILDAVIRLEVSKGHLSWKVTDLARISKVARPLIYYYFGKSKKEIVDTALKIIGDEFFGLSDARMKMWAEGKILQSVKKTRELLVLAPHVSEFYFHWRHKPGEISDALVELEKRHRKKIKKLYPGCTETHVDVIFAALFGLILTPKIQDKAIEALIDRIQTFLSNNIKDK